MPGALNLKSFFRGVCEKLRTVLNSGSEARARRFHAQGADPVLEAARWAAHRRDLCRAVVGTGTRKSGPWLQLRSDADAARHHPAGFRAGGHGATETRGRSLPTRNPGLRLITTSECGGDDGGQGRASPGRPSFRPIHIPLEHPSERAFRTVRRLTILVAAVLIGLIWLGLVWRPVG